MTLKKAPVSVCIIARNEAGRIENCLKSIRDHVEEIVVVDTGSTDNTPEIARKYADIFDIFTDCNDEEGRIEDFSLARNRSFDLATKDWAIWVDADDVVTGFEHLTEIIEKYKEHPGNVMIAFPYHYAHDEKGNPIVTQYRERLVYPRKKFKWLDPVHEVLEMPKDGALFNTHDEILFVHRRGNKVNELNRNLRILEKLYEKNGEENPRHLYYLGLEYGNVNNNEMMIKMLTRYVDLSGWDDERYMACLRMGQYYLGAGGEDNYKKAIKIAFKAISIKEEWGEAYFIISKAYCLLATISKGGVPERNYERCINFARQGLKFPPTQTLLFVNPMERKVDIHYFLNMALARLGRIEEALESCETGLQGAPDHPELLHNLKVYKRHTRRHKLNLELGKMLRDEMINKESYDSVINSLDGKPSIGWKFPVKPANYPLGISAASFPEALVSPNSEAWGIPDTIDLEYLPLKVSDKQLEAMVIAIWKQYILHDEILAGLKFLESAPVNARHSQVVEEAIKKNKAMLYWLSDSEMLQKHNSPADCTKEAGNPLPNPLFWSEGDRYYLVLNSLGAPGKKVCDFGSMDGCFTNRFGMAGHDVTGLDLSVTSVALANRKAEEFKTGAKHLVTMFQDATSVVEPGSFDFVTSSDSVEHLQDAVKEFFVPARDLLKEGGKCIVVTPYKSWLQGDTSDHTINDTHPWLWHKEGKNWLAELPRGHLIAPTPWSMAEYARKAGFYARNSYAVMGSHQNVTDQGNCYLEAWKTPVVNDKPLDIIFYVGETFSPWTPETVKRTGIGGSELMELQLARGLAGRGHRVRVYAHPGRNGEGIYDGVEYYHTNKFTNLKCDVLVVSRYANMLDDVYNVKAGLKLLHLHDTHPINWSNRLLLKADKILCLSQWHKDFVVKECGVHPDHIVVTRNGIDPSRFEIEVERKWNRIINSSSSDRGWKTLFECWERIRAEVPEAELHLYYGLEGLEAMARIYPEKAAELAYFKSQIAKFVNDGIYYHGKVDPGTLAKAFKESSVWAHGSNFTETACITAMEAQAGGTQLICSAVAALKETAGDRAELIEGDCNTPEFQEKFIKAIVKALKNDNQEIRERNEKYAKENFGLDSLVIEWEEMMRKEPEPFPYQPTKPYR